MMGFADIADRPLWVCWRAERRGQTVTKVPYSPLTGRPAKADDPATWGSARDSMRARVASLDTAAPYAGLGLEFADIGDGLRLGGVDLDACVIGPDDDPDLADWAAPIVDRLASYTELSPSGRGLKVYFLHRADDLPALREAMGSQWSKLWTRPKLADGGKTPAIELHLGNRFFAWTGWRLPDMPTTLNFVSTDLLLDLIGRYGPEFAGKPPAAALHRAEQPADAFDWDARRCPRDPAFDGAGALAGPAFQGQERDAGIARFVRLAMHRGCSPREIADWLAEDSYFADKLQPKRVYPPGEDEPMWQVRRLWGSIAYAPRSAVFGGLLQSAAPAPNCNSAAPADGGKGWRDRLIGSKKNKKLDLAANARLYLANHRAFAGCLSYDEFARRPIVSGSLPWRPSDANTLGCGPKAARRWDDADDRGLALWLQDDGVLISPRVAADAVDLVAREHAFHPVRNYLAGLQWDGRPRLDTMLASYFGADQEPADYLAAVGARWLISAVARIIVPGCQADHALIFEGLHQGEGKSTALRALAVRDEWFADQLPDDIASRSASLCLDGKWIVELSELSAMRRSDVEPVKAFISRRVEHYDPKFSNRTVDVPRQCVFAGSTNENEYLRDVTGNRRFWPVRCGPVALDALVADRDQLWAEAVHRHRAGERWWIDPSAEPELAAAAEDVQRSRLVTTSRDDYLADYLAGRLPVQPKPLASVTLTEIFVQLYGIANLKDRDPRIEQDIARRLTALGWTKRWIGPRSGPREKRYCRPQRVPYRRAAR